MSPTRDATAGDTATNTTTIPSPRVATLIREIGARAAADRIRAEMGEALTFGAAPRWTGADYAAAANVAMNETMRRKVAREGRPGETWRELADRKLHRARARAATPVLGRSRAPRLERARGDRRAPRRAPRVAMRQRASATRGSPASSPRSPSRGSATASRRPA